MAEFHTDAEGLQLGWDVPPKGIQALLESVFRVSFKPRDLLLNSLVVEAPPQVPLKELAMLCNSPAHTFAPQTETRGL